jgi:hypothetical protein
VASFDLEPVLTTFSLSRSDKNKLTMNLMKPFTRTVRFAESYIVRRPTVAYRHFTGAADKAENLVGCKSPHHQLPGRVVSISDACGGNEACSART